MVLARPPQSLLTSLVDKYGYLIGGDDLRKLLAFPSAAAFKKAQVRKAVPVELLKIPGRRSRYARTADVAHWLETQLCPDKKGGPS